MASHSGHDEQGTGKHPHKSTEEPYPHTKENAEHGSGGKSGGQGAAASRQGGSESSDLKSREYRDKDGNIHHHTHTSSEYKDEKK